MTLLSRVYASCRHDPDRWLLGGAALALTAGFLDPHLEIEQALFDHVVVLDVTQSMNVPDMQLAGVPVSRLAYAKHALRQSLLALPCGSKIGWGVFTESRSLLLMAPVEVCANLGELQSTLARIDGRMAWSGNSEIAKGLHSGIVAAGQLPQKPSLVFITDGHEAPPLNPRHRPAFDDKPGDVTGLVVGVGAPSPSPIPKTDLRGRPLGFWRADEVMQSDRRSQGRGASVSGEQMADDEAVAAPLPGVTPGSEHLSSLREGYLRLLASEKGMGFHRMQTPGALAEALVSPSLARPVRAHAGTRGAFAALALCLVLARNAAPLTRWVRALRARRTA